MPAATPASAARLSESWVLTDQAPVFLRASEGPEDAPVILHLHGFAISGRYMLPTAQELAGSFRTYVPDRPGFGRSPKPDGPLTIPALADAAVGVLDAVGVERATVLGNSLGCVILAALAQRHPDRIDRAVMVSPAGGMHNQPLLRAISQLAADAPREPIAMAAVAVPDYLQFGMVEALRLFLALTRFEVLGSLVDLPVPLLAVLGTRDPLLPPARRARQIAAQRQAPTSIAVIKGAAHAINFSHPQELAALVREFALGDAGALAGLAPGTAPIGWLSH